MIPIPIFESGLLVGIHGSIVLESIYKYLRRMKIVIKVLIVCLLLGLFLFQSWTTIKKYRAAQTSLQVQYGQWP
jgi:hypothetical protein